jgi:predicted nucleic acid-binding protein
MATDGRSAAIVDTSVLVNFLAIDRADLLASHPDVRFVVVDMVRDEVVKRTSHQRLRAAFDAGLLLRDGPPETISMAELEAFASVSALDALGSGERAAVAAAFARGLPLFMDDKRAWKKIGPICPGIVREDTVSLVVSLIKSGIISIAQADAMKEDWESSHSFRLRLESFAELL